MTFRFRNGGDYGKLLDDAKPVIEWLKANTAPDEAIWVNGVENQIYIEANRPSVCMQIIEAPREEPLLAPRVIVHCGPTAMDYNYKGYENALFSPIGIYTIMVRT